MGDPQREQTRRDARSIEHDVATVRGFLDYPTASGRDQYLRAIEALDRLALAAHAAEPRIAHGLSEQQRSEAQATLDNVQTVNVNGALYVPKALLVQAERERDLKHAQVNAYALRVTELEAELEHAERRIVIAEGLAEALEQYVIHEGETPAARAALAHWRNTDG